ncbi:MAG: MmcQ/YjbR family DNA-binding protein [Actinomycetota bacterium]
MATLKDVETIALSLPEVTKGSDDEGRPSFLVDGKVFCWHREPRKDAPFDDVFVFRTDGRESKELLLADPRGVFFTTPHWNGYPAVLVHIADLRKLKKAEVRDAVIEAWLSRAPKKLAKAWLAEND